MHADDEAKLLVTTYLTGELMQGTDHERRPDTYREAGRLLARLHAQLEVQDPDLEAREKAKALAWLAAQQFRAPTVRSRRLSWPGTAATLVSPRQGHRMVAEVLGP